mmetsp:Transcript_10772/g.34266  ORF Transcript_10772/g.34266 Transcript_10772/m.34266 type:complete len:656 (-) Transcript_10772:91-2058(-)|eukprot:CAMPEP_0196781014 /NCGR_PEP_ID=MMETSP1104-20130614/8999_1 /TAXON_ID=33652 /ORGANISM="Cafeteria sp., Strain Caron Lab Isolate" /LENGTH=655 /DNA_ID=CAMNT_0042151231 /DNA_START=35 /DNA_END=2002 /DNA_ORIENTATION=+
MPGTWTRDEILWSSMGIMAFTMFRLGFPLPFCVIVSVIWVRFLRMTVAASVRDLVRGLVDTIVLVFFKEVSSSGDLSVPRAGPVIFVCAPHANQFLDPAIITTKCPRDDIGFIIAAKSMKRQVIGTLARGFGAIPVTRAQDIARKMEGMVRLNPSDRQEVLGEGTKFTKVVERGGLVFLGKEGHAVAEVLSDTRLRLREPAEDAPPAACPFKYAPHVDHTRMFDQVWTRLREGRCIGIFPEGGSHDRPSLLPLKAGISIMALGAMAAHPGLQVRIVPTGLIYFNGHRFRSRAYVDFGEPLTVPAELVDRYREGGAAKRAACEELLASVRLALEGVTVNAPDYETLEMVWAVRRLYKPSRMRLTPDQTMKLTRRFLKGYMQLKDDPRLQQLREKVLNYNSMLKANGLKDHQVHRTTLNTWRALTIGSLRVLRMLFFGLCALPGLLLNLPVILIARTVSRRKAREAKAASTVKLAGRDVLASWKVLIALVLVPFLYCVGLALAAAVAVYAGWPVVHSVVYFAFAMPLFCYSSVLLIETEHAVWASLAPLFMSIMRRKRGERLRRTRRELKLEIRALVNEKVHTVFPQLKRVISNPASSPDASPSPSPTAAGGTGAAAGAAAAAGDAGVPRLVRMESSKWEETTVRPDLIGVSRRGGE